MVNYSDVKQLNDYLIDKSYIQGWQATSADLEVFKSHVSAPDAHRFPYASRWFRHIAAFTAEERTAFPRVEFSQSSSSAAPAKKDDDEIDLFGDEENDEEYERQLEERRKAAEAAKGKKEKDKPIAKSSVILDVKPWDDETDMEALEKAVREIEIEGLVWGASKLVPLAYGIKKLQISCVVVDDLVSIEELQERIEQDQDHVQSTDIQAFNKI